MLLLLIFPVLVAGFFACHIHPIHRERLHRYEGQYLYLKSAELGARCFVMALGLAAFLHYFIPDVVEMCARPVAAPGFLGWCAVEWTIPLSVADGIEESFLVFGAVDAAEAKKFAWFVQLSILTYVSALFPTAWGYISLRRKYGDWNVRRNALAMILDDSPLDSLLYRLSLQAGTFVMLTMSDRKVYVGEVINMGEPSATKGMDRDISLIPLMSGFRHEDNLKVEFTTSYEDVGEITLCLRQDQIASATEFDFDAYRVWNRVDKSSPTTSHSEGTPAPESTPAEAPVSIPDQALRDKNSLISILRRIDQLIRKQRD